MFEFGDINIWLLVGVIVLVFKVELKGCFWVWGKLGVGK